MNKQFNLYKVRVGRLLSLKSFSVAVLPFVLAVPLFTPHPVLAQEPETDKGPCAIETGRIDESYTFRLDEDSGEQYKITCDGEYSDITDTTFKDLLISSGSNIIIDLSKVTDATGAIKINVEALKTILVSSIGVVIDTGEEEENHSQVVINNQETISAIGSDGDVDRDGDAVTFIGDGSGTLDIIGSSLVGNIMFTEKDDVLNIENNVKIEGEIEFKDGNDEMDVDVIGSDQRFEVTKDVTGLTTLTKRGKGYARFGGKVEFEGVGALNLREGMLVIADDMNLGKDVDSKVTIYKPGRLVFEVGEKGKTGKIIADTMHFEDIEAKDASVYAVMNDDLTATQDTEAQNELASGPRVMLEVSSITSNSNTEGSSNENVKTLSIKAVKADGTTASDDVGEISYAGGDGTATFESDKVNLIAKLNPPAPPPNTSPSPASPGGGNDDNNDAILGLGLVAVLVALYWGDGLFGSSFADDYAFNTSQSAYITSVDERSTLTLRETGNQPYQVWIRTVLNDTMQLAGVKTAGVSGTEIGLSLYRSDDFYIEASSAQDVAAQVNSLNQAAQGEVYALSSGWQNERYFAGVKLSYGDFDTDTVIDNPVVNSTLISQSVVRHTQAQFTAGTRWNTGNLLFTPSASVQAGTFDYSAHQAQGAVVNANVPSYTQDYSALRVGLKMSASDWLSFSDDVKWKPHLQFDQIQTDSGSGGDVTLRQMDRLGALSFNSGASVQSMPEVVNAVSFGTSVKTSKSSQGEWKFGYAGLEADGEYYHAAVAAYQLRF